jgi:dienelactone hydrolase
LKRYITSVALVLVISGCAGGLRDSSQPIVSQQPALPVDFFPWQKQQPVEIPVIAGAPLSPSKPLRGLISKPDGEGPFPAVILLHGCSGLELDTPDRSTYKLLRDYAHRYNDRGYVALVLDSYQARGLVNVCNRTGARLDQDGRTWDAYSAVRYLKGLGYVDAKRIVVQGLANGGTTALTIASREYPVPEHIAAVIAMYPACEPIQQFTAPVLILVGGDDDWTPARDCEAMVTGNPKANAVSLKVYPGASHEFDYPLPVRIDSQGHRESFDPVAAADSWNQIDAFLARYAR